MGSREPQSMDGDYQEVWDKGTQGSVVPLHGLKKGVPAPAEQPRATSLVNKQLAQLQVAARDGH